MLAKLFRSKVRAKVLGWLYTHQDERFFVRQLESILDEDKTNLSRELARLADWGILKFQVEGRQKYFQADPACPVFQELRGMAIKTFGLADILRESLETLKDKIEVAFIYGGQAEKRATSLSDVDLMVIGKASFSDVVSALSKAQDALGREVNPTVYPPGEFRKKTTAGHHFLKKVMTGDKVFLLGGELELGNLVKKRMVK